MRFLLITSLFAAVLLGCARAAHTDTKADALLAKAIQAHGGVKALAKYKAKRIKLRIMEEATRMGYDHEYLVASPDKYKDVGDGYYLGQRITTTYATDGKVSWRLVMGKAEELEDQFGEWYKHEAHLYHVMRLVPLKEKEYELKAAGETKVDDKTAFGLLVRRKGQKDITLFFDAQTSLLVKTERQVTGNSGDQVKEEAFYQDYVKKDSMPYARKIVVKQDGKTVEQIDVREVTFLEKVDDKAFRPK
jgi:hypothetical protein